MDIFMQIGILLILGTVGALIAKFLKQPMIPVYILIGVLLGPSFHLITNSEVIASFSMIGIAFLLFIVGLEFNLKNIKYIGNIATFGGLIQVALIGLMGFVASLFLGFYRVEALFIGLIIAFSSTLVVVKILSDRRETTTLHGKIIIGILLMQDVIAILALSFISNLNGGGLSTIFSALIKAILIITVAYGLSKYIFPQLFKFAAKTHELLFLVSISVCFLFSLVFSFIGFSITIGAFIAGVTLGNLPYRLDIISKVKSLRDFFVILFFISLGLEVLLLEVLDIFVPLLVLTLIVVLLKPIVFLIIAGFFGYTKRTSFNTAIYLAQISEFSLIIAAEARNAMLVSDKIVTLTILLAILSISITAYTLKYEKKIYGILSKYLKPLGVSEKMQHLQYLDEEVKYDVILIGCDRIGSNVYEALDKTKKSYLVIDYNPDIIKELVRKKIHCLYGDISDYEIIDRIDIKNVEMIVSTIPDTQDNRYLIRRARSLNNKIIIFVTADTAEDAIELYKMGADYVILPHFLGGEKVSSLVTTKGTDLKDIIHHKYDHIEALRKRLKVRSDA